MKSAEDRLAAKRKFHVIGGKCLKIENDAGIVLSLAGDDSCRGDGVLDRLYIVFEDRDGNDVVPSYLSEDDKTELEQNGSLSVWADPERFHELLKWHMWQRAVTVSPKAELQPGWPKWTKTVRLGAFAGTIRFWLSETVGFVTHIAGEDPQWHRTAVESFSADLELDPLMGDCGHEISADEALAVVGKDLYLKALKLTDKGWGPLMATVRFELASAIEMALRPGEERFT